MTTNENLDPDRAFRHVETNRLLDALEAAQAARTAADDAVREAVIEARRKRIAWGRIGYRLGVSAQAAHQRYSRFTD